MKRENGQTQQFCWRGEIDGSTTPVRRLNAIALLAFLTTSLSFAFIGCIGAPSNPAATQPVTVMDLATTQPSYWFGQPANATVSSENFDTLWNACDDTARDFLFSIDRTDYRGGVLTTKPLTSRQWFEFWRPDVRTIYTLERSSLSAMRRTIRFEFVRQPDGTFDVSPKVLIEREAIAEQRITSVVSYGSIYQRPIKLREAPQGTRELDEGVLLPTRYWYAVGRDPALEEALARDVREKVKS